MLTFAALACDQQPTEVPDGPLLSHKPNHGGGGGGGGGGGPSGWIDVITTIPIGGGNQLLSDFASTGTNAYISGECGVDTYRGEGSVFFWPLHGLNKKQQRDVERDSACDDLYPRGARLDLANAVVHAVCVDNTWDISSCGTSPTTHTNEITLGDYITVNSLEAIAGRDDSVSGTSVHELADDVASQLTRGSFNLAYCLGHGGTGRPFRFDKDRNHGANDFMVTDYPPDTQSPATLSTQPGSNNVGSCAHQESNGDWYIFLLHMDVTYSFVDKP